MHWRTLLVAVPLIQIVFALAIIPWRQGREIFPIAQWNLFSRPRMHSVVLDVDVNHVDGKDFEGWRPFHKMATGDQNYELRRKLEFYSQPENVANREREIDNFLIEALRANNVRYQIVARDCELIEFFKTDFCPTRDVLVEHHAHR